MGRIPQLVQHMPAPVGVRPRGGGLVLSSIDWSAWYAARLESYADNDPTPALTDRGTHGNNASAAGAARPTFKTGVINGLPVARFDGVANTMQSVFALSQPTVVFVVCRFLSVYASVTYVYDGVTGSHLVKRTSAVKLSAYGGSGQIDATTTPQSWHIATTVFNGVSSSHAIDNDAPIAGSLGTNPAGGVTLGSSSFPALFGNIDIAEFMVYAGTLSAAQIAGTKAALNAIYAIY